SSNSIAFLAIVAHYVINDEELDDSFLFFQLTDSEELLVDFQELISAHSGENMAEVVWETLELYGLK
ncbi:hypothetical protein EDB83DRAFT_2197766, partial [Lactarius deliciosus]